MPGHETTAAGEGSRLAAVAALVSLAGCAGDAAPLPGAFSQRADAKRSRVLAAAADTAVGASGRSTPTADELMDWAQKVYPDFFPGSPPSQTWAPYVYRHYAATGNYIGIAEGRVYVLGTISDGQLLDVGALSDFADLIATDYRVAKPTTDEEAARFLLQAQFSASRSDIAHLRSIGYAAWLDEQKAAPRDITAWDWLGARGYTKIDSYGYYGNAYQVSYALWYQLIATRGAHRARIALALSEFFVAYLDGVGSAWRAWVLCDYWDLLADQAFGNFRTLLGKLPTNSAIGQVLSIIGSQKADPQTGRMPDENFARELMQLFTIGLYELNPDGSERLDAHGRRIETYAQNDVTQLARVFTGYNLAAVKQSRVTNAGTTFDLPDISQARLPLVCDPALHSTEDVAWLGLVIPGSLAPEQKIQRVLDHLFQQPNVGPFFGRQMIQRLVTSNPSPGYVSRVTAAFNDNGAGVRGDLAAVFKAILLDPEARGAGGLASNTFGKVRDPMVRVAQLGRSLGMNSKAGSWKLGGMPQTPLGADSVFGFVRPGNRLPGDLGGGQALLSPEFMLVNEVSVANWVNLVRGICTPGFFVPAPDIPAFYRNQFDQTIVQTAAAGYDITCSLEDELPLVGDADALIRHLNLVLAAGQISAETCQAIAAGLRANFPGLTPASPLDVRLQFVCWAVTTILSVPEYIVQK